MRGRLSSIYDTSQAVTVSPAFDGRARSFVTDQISPNNKIVKENELPFNSHYINNGDSDEGPYDFIEFDKEIIKSLVLQLITGSIIIPNASKIDVKKWAQGMVPLYERRFGKGERGMKLCKAWAEGYIEFLCWFTEDSNLIDTELDDNELAAICARDIIKELIKFPENVYIKEYINILEGYLI